jgi:DUF177 domain-containing protein
VKKLLVDVAKIPPEGLEVDADLDEETLRLEGEEGFILVDGHLKSRLERGDDESVHVRGHLDARMELQCGRCLETFDLPISQDLELFYLPHGRDGEQEDEDEVELSDRDMVVSYYRDRRLDLAEVVREQIYLAVPLKPVCREQCAGLCPSCGVNRNATACACKTEEPLDPRLAPLRKLFDKD